MYYFLFGKAISLGRITHNSLKRLSPKLNYKFLDINFSP